MAVSLTGFPAAIQSIIQQNTLERIFHDALFPRLLYRLEATPDAWAANLGETMVFTKPGLIAPAIDPLTPGSDPTPATYNFEQWRAVASQYGGTIDTHMPSSDVALASLFARNTHQLGLQAGQTLNRLARNRAFTAYLSGETVTTGATTTSTTVQVASINGFTETLDANGSLSPVSAANPIPVTFTTSTNTNTVIGAVPADPAVPLGPGTLTLSAAESLALREGILASTRARRLRVGGADTIDGLGATNSLTLNDVISAVSRLRDQNVAPHADGYYHVHLSPLAEAQIFRDNHWQRLHQSLPDNAAYRDLAIGQAVGCRFYRNTEDPSVRSVNSTIAVAGTTGGSLVSPEIGGMVTNDAGLQVVRTLVTGGGVMYEKYIDESRYITEGGTTGKIGNFSVVNGGVAVMTNRIRFILRSPLDRLQQVYTQSWSWSGDFPVPSDRESGDAAAFKRAVIIESAGSTV